MPVYKPGQLPKTGIAWVDAILRAVHEDPTGAGPTAFGVPAKILTRPGPARALKGELARRMPKFFKAAEKAPDVTLAYPASVGELSAAYEWGKPVYTRTPGIRIAKDVGRDNPLSALVHELLHHLYWTKNVPKFMKGAISQKQLPYPIRSEKIARAYEHLTPNWLESALAMKYTPSNPAYWGEQAIEGMEALMRSKMKP